MPVIRKATSFSCAKKQPDSSLDLIIRPYEEASILSTQPRGHPGVLERALCRAAWVNPEVAQRSHAIGGHG
jgi:hypothetical protein